MTTDPKPWFYYRDDALAALRATKQAQIEALDKEIAALVDQENQRYDAWQLAHPLRVGHWRGERFIEANFDSFDAAWAYALAGKHAGVGLHIFVSVGTAGLELGKEKALERLRSWTTSRKAELTRDSTHPQWTYRHHAEIMLPWANSALAALDR